MRPARYARTRKKPLTLIYGAAFGDLLKLAEPHNARYASSTKVIDGI